MEARSEPGVMGRPEPGMLAAGESSEPKSMPRSPVKPQPPVSNMRLVTSSDGTAMYKSIGGRSPPPGYGGGGSGGGGNSGSSASQGLGVGAGEPVKRKRGRPRKYGPNGTFAVPLTTLSPGSSPRPISSSAVAIAVAEAMKKARGRPPGSSKKQQMEALGSAGIGFTPHIITIKTGEDVASKIMAFSQQGPHAVCILSANGAVSNVSLRQAATSGGTVTYEGPFEILSLSGSFLLSENDGQRSRTGGLSVCLAGPDGRVLGGGVAGLLTAACPVQVVAGSFIADGKKETAATNPSESVSATGKLAVPVGVSQGTTPSESPDGRGSPLDQSISAFNNSNQKGLSNKSCKQ